jgi:hypothetical protein
MTVLVSVSSAIAQPSNTPEPPSASTLFDEGRQLLDAGHPAEACAKFTLALQLEPEDLGVMLNLGLCNEQLDRLATALKWFRRAQLLASERARPDTEAAAKDKAAALVGKLATLAISAAPDAAVTVDNNRIETIDLGRVEVDAGHHVIEATAKGQSGRIEVDVQDGEAKAVAVDITVPTPVAKHYVTIDRGRDARRNAYIIGGVGGGLVVASGVLGLVGHIEYGGTEHPDTQQRWQDLVRYGGTSMFVVGGAGLAIAAWLYFHAPGPERVEQTVVAPTIGRGSIGFSIGGAL